MSSLIFRAAARVLMPLLLIFAIFLFFRGHNAPGGGFVGGLVIAVAFVLRMLAEGTESARAALLVSPKTLLPTGLLLALGSGFVPVFMGRSFLSAEWLELGPPEWGLLVGTPLIFDLGVAFVVIGVVLNMTFGLAED